MDWDPLPADRPEISEEDRDTYQGVGVVLVLLMLLVVFVSAVYAPQSFGLVLAAVLFSFLLPFALAMFTLRKVFLVAGLALFGGLLVTVAIASLVFRLPGVAGLPFGVASLAAAYAGARRPGPLFGFR